MFTFPPIANQVGRVDLPLCSSRATPRPRRPSDSSTGVSWGEGDSTSTRPRSGHDGARGPVHHAWRADPREVGGRRWTRPQTIPRLRALTAGSSRVGTATAGSTVTTTGGATSEARGAGAGCGLASAASDPLHSVQLASSSALRRAETRGALAGRPEASSPSAAPRPSSGERARAPRRAASRAGP